MISRAWSALLRFTRYTTLLLQPFVFQPSLLKYNKILFGIILMRSYFYFRIDRLFSKKQHLKPKKDTKKTDEINEDEEEPELFVERIRLEKIELRLLSVLIQMRYTTKLILLHAYTFLVPV